MPLSWTDWCFLIIVLLSGFFLQRCLQREHIRTAWQRAFSKPLAVSAAIVFMGFLSIAILDSLHVTWQHPAGQNGLEAETILDHLLEPLDTFYEKTYVAPLSLNLYNQEVLVEDNQIVQSYPPVSYRYQHFQNRSKNSFISSVVIQTACLAALLTLVVMGALRWAGFRPMWAPLFTFFVCIWLISGCYELSRELHVFGTGKIGQDIFYYTLKSIRTGLVIGTVTTLFMLPFAVILGMCAGYFGGRVDDVIQYIYTTLSSIPGVLLITASILSMQTYIANHPQQFPTLAESADARLLALCMILGVTSWTNLCRILRAETLKWRELEFVQAAKVLGTGSWSILRRHILPNLIPVIIITLVLDFSFLVLAEAVLSYVGVGVSPLTISWGNMINGARLELARDPLVWWPIGAAFLFMFILVLASNLLVDALRDGFDRV